MSAIHKFPVDGPVRVGYEGLEGDAQGDRRVHGGPEKAVHQYALRHYGAWAARFPQAAAELQRGSFGENLSTDVHDETTVCIGDRYQVGSVLLEVSQPRRPCWKLDVRFTVDGLAQAVQESGWSGWYYRVLQTGALQVGDNLELVWRAPATVSLAEFWRSYHSPEPDLKELEHLQNLPGLSAGWRQKIAARRTGLPLDDDPARLRRG